MPVRGSRASATLRQGPSSFSRSFPADFPPILDPDVPQSSRQPINSYRSKHSMSSGMDLTRGASTTKGTETSAQRNNARESTVFQSGAVQDPATPHCDTCDRKEWVREKARRPMRERILESSRAIAG